MEPRQYRAKIAQDRSKLRETVNIRSFSTSTHTLLTCLLLLHADTFKEHLTNAINQRYAGIYRPPATTDLQTYSGGGGRQVDTCGRGGGVKNGRIAADVLDGQAICLVCT